MKLDNSARAQGSRLGWIASACLLVGCAHPGDTASQHSVADPGQYGAAATQNVWPAAQWWQVYGDAELNRVQEQAAALQPSLKVVHARLQQAQAATQVTHSQESVQVAASLDLTDQRFTQHGMIPPPLAGATMWNNNVQLGASWEWDVWGRQRAALQASLGQQRVAQAEEQAARVLLSSQVASAYFNLARWQAQSEWMGQTLAQREHLLALVRQRVAAGLETQTEQRLAEGAVAQTQLEQETTAEALALARHALAELSGQGPTSLESLAPQLQTLRSQTLPSELPLDLVGHRADLVALRWRVEAASHTVDAARGQFYPNINLVAFTGLSSLGLEQFLKSGSRTYGAGPAIHLPIFEGGRLRAQLQSRQAEYDAAVESYNATLLRALREVADGVSTLRAVERQQAAQAAAHAAAQATYTLAQQRYQAGLGNLLGVLNAQSQVLQLGRAQADLKARHLVAEVALVQALGGGYVPEVPAASATQTASSSSLSVEKKP